MTRVGSCCLALSASAILLAGCGGKPSATSGVSAGRVTAARVAAAGSEPDQWLTAGRDAAGSYHSPLKILSTHNLASLGFAWDYDLGTHRGLEATPLVVDGILYTSGNFGRVVALDAETGRLRWSYDPTTDLLWARNACCDAVNRGIAVWDGMVYVAALDGWLHAVDAGTGRSVWKTDTVAERRQNVPYTLTGSPVIAGDLVLIGNAGADFGGVRGYLSAYDRRTGQLRWQFYTVPRDPVQGPQDQPHLLKAIDTWDPQHPWAKGSGGTVWDGISFDAALGLIYFGTGNGAPYNIKDGQRRGGDDLYAASIIAVHADTGAMAWYYQTVPGDQWDYDSTQKMVLADLPVGGETRKVLMQASKNGFYYVLDRATGELLNATSFANVTWTQGIDRATGRPVPQPAADYNSGPALVSPSIFGAHSWQPMSYDTGRKWAFIPVMESPNILIESTHRPVGLVDGNFTVQAYYPADYDPVALKPILGDLPAVGQLTGKPAPAARGVGMLRAFDPVAGRIIWEHQTASSNDGGVVSTDGGWVAQGDFTGHLNFYAADSGTLLRSIELGSTIMASPMTYAIKGVQYVAVMAGYGGSQISTPFPPGSAAQRYGNEGRIIVLKIGGGAVPLPVTVTDDPFPKPLAAVTGTADIGRGELLYYKHCARCHVFGRGVLPDLRRLSPAVSAMFPQIVLQGAFGSKGMGRFDDILSAADAAAIFAYLNSEAWKAWTAQQAR